MVRRSWQQVFLWQEEHMETVGSLLSRPGNNRPGRSWDCKPHGLLSSDIFCPASIHLTKIPYVLKTAPPPGDQISKHMILWGIVSHSNHITWRGSFCQCCEVLDFFALSNLKVRLQNFLSKVVLVTGSSIWFLYCRDKTQWPVGSNDTRDRATCTCWQTVTCSGPHSKVAVFKLLCLWRMSMCCLQNPRGSLPVEILSW